jgi:hypothetical protein
MKMGGASYKGADRVISGSSTPDFRQTTAPMDGAGPDYTGHSGSTPSTPDFPESKPPMDGSPLDGSGCEPKIGDCK